MQIENSEIAHSATLSLDLRNPTLVSFLDFCRWIAAAVVFIGHLRNPLFLGYSELAPQERTLLVKAWYFATGLHAEAVIVFFVLSGLLVAGVGRERLLKSSFDARSYAVDRFSRLYVAFLPALMICYLADSIGSTYWGGVGFWNHTHPMIAQKVASEPFETQLTLATFASNCLMLQSYWSSPLGSNQPLWTISTEFWFYVTFGMAAVAAMANGTKRWAVLSMLTALILFLGVQFPIYLGYWLVGMLIGSSPRLNRLALVLSASVFALILLTSRIWQAELDQSTLHRTLKDFAVAISFALLIAAMRGKEVGIFRLTARFNKFFADFSYSLYLLHFPLMLFILALINSRLSLPGITTGYSPTSNEGRLVYLAVILLVYIISWGFSRLTEAKTAQVRGYLKSCFLESRVGNAS